MPLLCGRAHNRTILEGPRTGSSFHPKNLTVRLVHIDHLPRGTDLGCPLLSLQERSCEAPGAVPGWWPLPVPPLPSLSPLTAHQSRWPLGRTLYLTGGVQGQAAFKRPSIPPTASKTLQLNVHPRPGNSISFSRGQRLLLKY